MWNENSISTGEMAKGNAYATQEEREALRERDKVTNEVTSKTMELGLMKGAHMTKSITQAIVNPFRGFDIPDTTSQDLIKQQRKDIAGLWDSAGIKPTLLDDLGLGLFESFMNPVEFGAGLLSGGVMSSAGLGVFKTFLGEQSIDLAYDTMQTIETEGRFPTLKEMATNMLVNAGFEGVGKLVRSGGVTSHSESLANVRKLPAGEVNTPVDIKKEIENLHDNLTGVEGDYSAEMRIESGDHTTYLQKSNESKIAYEKNVEQIEAKNLEIKAIDDQMGLDIELKKDVEIKEPAPIELSVESKSEELKEFFDDEWFKGDSVGEVIKLEDDLKRVNFDREKISYWNTYSTYINRLEELKKATDGGKSDYITVYHATPKESVETIIKEGLKGDPNGYYGPAFSTNPNSAKSYARQRITDNSKPSVLEYRIPISEANNIRGNGTGSDFQWSVKENDEFSKLPNEFLYKADGKKVVEIKTPNKTFDGYDVESKLGSHQEILSDPEYFKENKNRELSKVVMTPDEYIEECAEAFGIPKQELMESRDRDMFKKYAEDMRNGDKFPPLSLDYSQGKFSQEGIHRALASRYNGVNEVPVMIVEKVNRIESDLGPTKKFDNIETPIPQTKTTEQYKDTFDKKKILLTQEIENLENNNKEIHDVVKPHIRVMSDNLYPLMKSYNKQLRDRKSAVMKLANERGINPAEADKIYGKELTLDNVMIENVILKVDSKYTQDIRQAQKQYNILLGEDVNRYMKSDDFNGNGYDYGDLLYGGLYELHDDPKIARLLKQSDIDNSIIWNRSKGGDGGKLATITNKDKVLGDFNEAFNHEAVVRDNVEHTIDFDSYANDVVPEGWDGKVKEGSKVTTIPREEYADIVINKETWPAFKEKLADITKSNPVGAKHVEAMYSRKREALRKNHQAEYDKIDADMLELKRERIAKYYLHGAEANARHIASVEEWVKKDRAKAVRELDRKIFTKEMKEQMHDEVYRDVAVDMHSMMNDIANSRASERGRTNIETMGLDWIAKKYPMFGGDKFFHHTPYRKNNIEIMTDIYNVTAKKSAMLQNYGEVDGDLIKENFKKDFQGVMESSEYANRSMNMNVEQEVFLKKTSEIFDNLMDHTLVKNTKGKEKGQKAFDEALNLIRWKVMAGSGVTEFVTNPTMVDVRMSKYANINSTIALAQTGQGVLNADGKYMARASMKVVEAKSTGKYNSNKSLKEKMKNAGEQINDLGYIFQEVSDDMTQLMSHASITKLMHELPADFKVNTNEVIDTLRRSGITETNYEGFRNYSKKHIEGNDLYLDVNLLTDVEHFGLPADKKSAGQVRAFYNDMFFDVGSPVNRQKVMNKTKGNLNKMQMTFRGWSRSMGDQGLKRLMYAKNGEGAMISRNSMEGVGLTMGQTGKKIKNNPAQTLITGGIMLASGLANKQVWNTLYGDVTFPEAIAVMKADAQALQEAYEDKQWGELSKEIILPALLEQSGLKVLGDGGFSFKNEAMGVKRAIEPYWNEQNRLNGTNVQEGLKASGIYLSEFIVGTKVRRFGDKLRLKVGFGDEALSSTHLKDPTQLYFLWQQFNKEDRYDQAEVDKTERLNNFSHNGPVKFTPFVDNLYEKINGKLNFPKDQTESKKKELQFMRDNSSNEAEFLYFMEQRWGISEGDL